MEIKDKRINKLISKFRSRLGERNLDDVLEFTEYPGGVVWLSEKQLSPEHEDSVAYVKCVIKHGSTPGQKDTPLFKIVLVKERVLKLNDRDFLATLAHEYAHVLMKGDSRSGKLGEYASDILGRYLFGYKKSKGSLLGYIHDKEAFEKIHGTKKADNTFRSKKKQVSNRGLIKH